jgi:hypothetical protein
MRAIPFLIAALLAAAPATASDVGLIKVANGSVLIERAGVKTKAEVGAAVRAADVLHTGADGSAGVTFSDNSLLSIGPNTVFAIDQYQFDSTTHAGRFEGSLRHGRLAAVSGKIVKQSPDAMKIRTPASVMGVRGTQFVVQVDEPGAVSR